MTNGAPRINELSVAGQVVRARVRPAIRGLIRGCHAANYLAGSLSTAAHDCGQGLT